MSYSKNFEYSLSSSNETFIRCVIGWYIIYHLSLTPFCSLQYYIYFGVDSRSELLLGMGSRCADSQLHYHPSLYATEYSLNGSVYFVKYNQWHVHKINIMSMERTHCL